MNYIILNYSPYHEDGISQVVNKLLSNFSSSLINNVVLICNDLKRPDEFNFGPVKCINLKTRNFFVLDVFFLYSRLRYSYRIYKFIKKNIKDGDVVNIHEGAGISFFLSLFRKKIHKNIKTVVTLHGSLFSLYSDFYKRFPPKYIFFNFFLFFWRWYFWIIEKIIFDNVNFCIFITDKTKNLCERLYGFKKQSIVIPNGFENDAREFKSGEKIKEKMIAIIVGSRVHTKGLDIAIKALEKINSLDCKIELNVIGFPDFFDNYSTKEVPNFVNYVGLVKPKDMKFWYRKSDFLLLPSRSEEPPSLVVLESLQYGLPIVVSGACVGSQIDPLEMFGYIENGYSIKAWEKNIEKIYNMENYNKFVCNIRKKDFSEFNWKNLAKKYEAIIF